MDARTSYREAAVRGADPVQLVVFLYEQVVEDVRRALAALLRGDVEARTREINHALKVIGHLQGTLDTERGGGVAGNLEVFYNQVRKGLVEAQFQQSAKLLEEQIAHLMVVREAWVEVQRMNPAPVLTPPRPASSDIPTSSSEWNA
jgi:flagellar protein FliS